MNQHFRIFITKKSKSEKKRSIVKNERASDIFQTKALITELEKQVSLLKHKREKPSSVVEEQFIKDSVAKIFHQADLQIQEADIPKIICNDLKIQSRVLEAIQDDKTGTLGDWDTVGSNYERKSNDNTGQTDKTSQKLNKNKEARQEIKESSDSETNSSRSAQESNGENRLWEIRKKHNDIRQ